MKPRLKTPPGSVLPLLIFERLEKAGADARGRADFVPRDAAQFALSLQTFAKSRIYSCQPVAHLDDLGHTRRA